MKLEAVVLRHWLTDIPRRGQMIRQTLIQFNACAQFYKTP